MEIKALACQLPKDLGLPFSRLVRKEIAQEAIKRALSPRSAEPRFGAASAPTRRPAFKPGGVWLRPPPKAGRSGRIEHEYERKGALAYLAAWDVRRAKVFGLCCERTGIASFHQLVDLVMSQPPYRSARRVFWITDNGSSHRGKASAARLKSWYSNAVLVHTPVHASWLNQVEIYFSVLQRKVLSPNDFENLGELEGRILSFQSLYEATAKPFAWKFSREDLKASSTFEVELTGFDFPAGI